jgi:peptidoglycan/LPS O-acetylase OafA/YrhL
MVMPNGAIIPLFIASFVVLALQYYRTNPDRRVFNLHFLLMMGAVVLMLATVFYSEGSLSLVFFGLAVAWLGIALLLFRSMPPPRN